MGCTDMPKLPLPSLGGGLSVSVPLPPVSLDAALCCKILSFDVVPPPIGFAVPIPPGLMNIMVAQLKLVQTYIDAIPPGCPKE